MAVRQLRCLASTAHPPSGSQHLLGAGLGLAIDPILLAAHHGLGIDHIGLVARGAGQGPRWHFFTGPAGSLLGAAAAVDALAVEGGLVLGSGGAVGLAQGPAGGLAVKVGLAAAALHVLHKAVIAAGPGAAQGLAVGPAGPALHLAVGAVAPALRVPFQGPVVQLWNTEHTQG